MSSNPKVSPWRSTPAARRHRRGVQVMLSDEARAKLDRLAPAGRRSEVVELLILTAPEPETK